MENFESLKLEVGDTVANIYQGRTATARMGLVYVIWEITKIEPRENGFNCQALKISDDTFLNFKAGEPVNVSYETMLSYKKDNIRNGVSFQNNC